LSRETVLLARSCERRRVLPLLYLSFYCRAPIAFSPFLIFASGAEALVRVRGGRSCGIRGIIVS